MHRIIQLNRIAFSIVTLSERGALLVVGNSDQHELPRTNRDILQANIEAMLVERAGSGGKH
jgi:hypothetical protein